MDKTQNVNNSTAIVDDVLNKMFSVGAHFGFVKSRRHPSAKSFIFGVKNKIEIFDLEKTKEKLDKALEFVKTIAAKNGSIFFIGGKNEAHEAVETVADSINMPYVSGRFIGGTLTNFPEIRKRVLRLEDLVSQKEKGELAKYTKKERLLIDREIDTLRRLFFGLSVMKKLPDAVFVVDSKKESIALAEAIELNIPVIALCGSDNNITPVDYPIPGNDASKASIEFFLRQVASAYKEGLLKRN
jgi:small subunit ribosomal protein S2